MKIYMGGRAIMEKNKNKNVEVEIGKLLEEADLELKEDEASERGIEETKQQIQDLFTEGTIDQKYE